MGHFEPISESLMNFVLIGDYLTKNLWNFPYTIFSYSYFFLTAILISLLFFFILLRLLCLKSYVLFFILKTQIISFLLFIKIKKNKNKKKLSWKWNWVRTRSMFKNSKYRINFNVSMNFMWYRATPFCCAIFERRSHITFLPSVKDSTYLSLCRRRFKKEKKEAIFFLREILEFSSLDFLNLIFIMK